mgnify:CR=1 FL=1
MQHSLTQGPITKNILLFALPLMFGNLLIIFLGIAATFLYNYFANLLPVSYTHLTLPTIA